MQQCRTQDIGRHACKLSTEEMEFFTDILQYSYLSNALIAAVLCGIVGGIVGTYIVARRMVFLCGGITHASFGGLGIAIYLGINPIVGALGFAILSSLGIEWASERGKIREDSAIGIIWSIGMAVGALFMSLAPGYTSGDLASYMFGSIISVTTTDLYLLSALTLLCIVGYKVWWRQIMYVAFDKHFAKSQGLDTQAISYLMSIIVAVTIVMAIRIMGIVLLLSLFTIPVVAANSLTKSYRKITLGAVFIAIAGAITGLTASYYMEIPSGASIIFTLTLMLIAVKTLSLRSKK